MLRLLYDRWFLRYPKIILVLVFASLGVLFYYARQLQVDASAETLMLEDDDDLKYSRIINQRYGSPDFLVVTFTPKAGELLSDDNLLYLGKLQKELEGLKTVDSVTSILNIPLLQSPPKPLKDLIDNIPTLETVGIDKNIVKQELLNSPIYRELIVSPDFKTTALQVNLKSDGTYQSFIKRRAELKKKKKEHQILPEEEQELQKLQKDFKTYRDQDRLETHNNIITVRNILERHRDHARIFLGGVSMIGDDLVTYVKNDLAAFGLGVLAFLIVTLAWIFRRLRWVLLPMLCCAFSVLATAGFLGMMGWEVTIISSNFVSLQLILTMSLTIHMIVHYKEAQEEDPDASQRDLVLRMIMAIAKPCFYTTITTLAGFISLAWCNILPIIQFGWMMSVGVFVSLIYTFLLFPLILLLLKKIPLKPSEKQDPDAAQKGAIPFLAHLTAKHGRKIMWVSFGVLVFSISGSAQLMVENSFISYFKKTTEIYQGMKMIDQQLGGTTPLDVILDFKPVQNPPVQNPSPVDPAVTPTSSADTAGGPEGFDEFEAEFEARKNEAQYWFTAEKMQLIEKTHDYLDSIPEVGKVLSLGTLSKVGRTLNENNDMDNFMLALVYNKLPERFRKIILSPYVSVEHEQVRFSLRIRDSEPTLRRNELLKRIKYDLEHKVGLKPEQFRLAGLMVLYNNMLQGLFNSQILTIGAVLPPLFIMFLILFRSFTLAWIALLPNMLSIAAVMGFMGWAKIPLDMMTITLASVSAGVGVEDAIHYIHRFGHEFKKDYSYENTMYRCHGSIGHAMYYTSVTVIVGFSILVLSNFTPSRYFGLLIGVAMTIAIIASLTLLPQLILMMKPFGPEKPSA